MRDSKVKGTAFALLLGVLSWSAQSHACDVILASGADLHTFNNNRRIGAVSCNGINVKGSLASVIQSGNVSTPSGVICSY